MSEVIRNKNVVTFNYQILDEEGNIMEHSGVPMEYIHGVSGTMYPKVELAPEGKVAARQRYKTLRNGKILPGLGSGQSYGEAGADAFNAIN